MEKNQNLPVGPSCQLSLSLLHRGRWLSLAPCRGLASHAALTPYLTCSLEDKEGTAPLLPCFFPPPLTCSLFPGVSLSSGRRGNTTADASPFKSPAAEAAPSKMELTRRTAPAPASSDLK